MVVWDREQQRVWLAGIRVHHGAVGVILGIVGLLLALHDRGDNKQWFRIERYVQDQRSTQEPKDRTSPGGTCP